MLSLNYCHCFTFALATDCTGEIILQTPTITGKARQCFRNCTDIYPRFGDEAVWSRGGSSLVMVYGRLVLYIRWPRGF